MRSGAISYYLERHEGMRVDVLRDGYKGFRQFILKQFEQKLPLAIVSGKTGSGKT